MADEPKKFRPLWHESQVTGKRYAYDEYTNHGYGGIKYGFKDLPADEYPYTVIYEDRPKPKWMED